MRNTVQAAAVGLALLVGSLAWAKSESAPLIYMKREGAEGMVWEDTSVSMGKQSLAGSIQGLGSPGTAVISYDLNGEWDVLEAWVGYKKNAPSRRRAKFLVLADQVTLFTSDEMKGGDEPEFIRVPVPKRKYLQLRIEPSSYDSSLGACFGGPVLKRGLTPEEMTPPYRIDIDGQHFPYERFSAPATLPINLPIKPGEATYQVKIKHDTEKRRIEVITTP